MSSLTIDTIGVLVRRRVNAPVSDRPRFETMVNDALKALARRVSLRPDRALLVVSINKTPSSGKIDLSDAAFAAILIDTYKIEGAIATQAETDTVFQHVSSIPKMRATTPTDPNYVLYHLQDRALVFKDPAGGALDTYATALKLAGSRIPTLSDMPSVLDNDLIDEVERIAKGQSEAPTLNIKST